MFVRVAQSLMRSKSSSVGMLKSQFSRSYCSNVDKLTAKVTDISGYDPNQPYFLKDKVILVTGASSGIGETTAEHLADLGAHVVCTARRTDLLTQLVERINEADNPGSASMATMDVSNEDQTRSTIRDLFDKHEHIHGAFNNAGTNSESSPDPLEEISEAFDTSFTVNVRGVWLCIQELMKGMREGGKGGRIVNNSSISSLQATPMVPLYAATKAAVDSMTKSYAILGAPSGITVNSINPGFTLPSELLGGFLETSAEATGQDLLTSLQGMAKRNPRQKFVHSLQIAHQVANFMHPLEHMTTGQCVAVCGGDGVPRIQLE